MQVSDSNIYERPYRSILDDAVNRIIVPNGIDDSDSSGAKAAVHTLHAAATWSSPAQKLHPTMSMGKVMMNDIYNTRAANSLFSQSYVL
jgi:hypothetical protein